MLTAIVQPCAPPTNPSMGKERLPPAEQWHAAGAQRGAAHLDDGLPEGEVEVEVLDARRGCRSVAREEHHRRVGLDRHKAERKHVARAAVVALEHGVAERGLRVQAELFVAATHEVLHDARAPRVDRAVAEPLARYLALRHARRAVHAAVPARGCGL